MDNEIQNDFYVIDSSIRLYVDDYTYNSFSLREDTPFKTEEKKAIELLTPNRLDIVSKYMLLIFNKEDICSDLALKVYKEHIRIFSLGRFYEPGNENKKCFRDFLEQFEQLFNSIEKNGYLQDISYIPLAKDGSILNGAHRTATAIYLRKNVNTIKILNVNSVDYGYDFFLKRHLNKIYLHFMVINYLKLSRKNIYTVCLWPVACQKEKNDSVEKIIKEKFNIIYSERIYLNYKGLINFIIQVYANQKWIGEAKDHFVGAKNKANYCYADYCTAFYFIEGRRIDDVLDIKDKIRKIYGMGKHSVHITDNKNETRSMAEIILNENSIRFLNYGNPYKDIDLLSQIKSKQTELISNPKIMLLLYGIQTNCYNKTLSEQAIEKKMDFKYDIRNYFYFDGIKVISPGTAMEFLNTDDIKYCKKILNANNVGLRNRIMDIISRGTYLIKRNIIFYLIKFKIYNYILSLYHKVRE